MDKRQFLKVKLKTLAEEARIIRHEERKYYGMDRWDLQHHRKTVVRDEARRTLIAYQFIRGRNWKLHVSSCDFTRATDIASVQRMIRQYGSKESWEGLKAFIDEYLEHRQALAA